MYIGNDLQIANPSYRIIDDISSSFNGSTTSFALQVGGSTPVPFPISTQQVMVSVNGVVQEPDPSGSAGFKLLGSNIVFSSAPANGHAFFGVIYAGADYVTAGSKFPDGTVASPSFTFENDTDTGLYRLGSGSVGFSSNGVLTSNFDGNGLTVTGTCTATSFSGNGSSVTHLNLGAATNTGTVSVARLGSGATSSKFLRGDNTWQTISATPEGTSILSTGESGGTKFLREDGDGTCSWQAVAGGLSSDAQQNTVGGTNAGDSFTGTDAEKNTLIGYDAGTALTSGDNNVCIGNEAGKTITTHSGHTFIGGNAGKLVSGGGSNIAIGIDSMSGSAVTGYNNIAMGTETLNALTSAQYNICIGYRAGYTQTAGGINIFMGRTAGRNVVLGSGNIAIGTDAMYAASSCNAANNLAIGNSALRQIQSNASWNFAFGHNVLYNITTGDNNTGVGYAAGYDATTVNNCLFLGNDAGRSDSPSGAITTSGDGTVCLGNNFISNLYCADTSISSSDSRDKTDVTNFTHGLDWVKKLNPITYRWDRRTWYKEYNEDGSLKTAGTPDGSKKRARQHIGFLAQDVLAVEQADGFASKKDDMLVVNLNEDDTAYGLKYERLVPVLVNAIKELSAKVETLEAKLA